LSLTKYVHTDLLDVPLRSVGGGVIAHAQQFLRSTCFGLHDEFQAFFFQHSRLLALSMRVAAIRRSPVAWPVSRSSVCRSDGRLSKNLFEPPVRRCIGHRHAGDILVLVNHCNAIDASGVQYTVSMRPVDRLVNTSDRQRYRCEMTGAEHGSPVHRLAIARCGAASDHQGC